MQEYLQYGAMGLCVIILVGFSLALRYTIKKVGCIILKVWGELRSDIRELAEKNNELHTEKEVFVEKYAKDSVSLETTVSENTKIITELKEVMRNLGGAQ